MTETKPSWSDVRAGVKQAWHLNRGDLAAFTFAITAVLVAGVIGGGPVWLVAALVSMQLVNAARITYFRARGVTEARAFMAYLDTLDHETPLAEWEKELLAEPVAPGGESADL